MSTIGLQRELTEGGRGVGGHSVQLRRRTKRLYRRTDTEVGTGGNKLGPGDGIGPETLDPGRCRES